MGICSIYETYSTRLILLDVQMPIMDGICNPSRGKKLYPNIKIIMLTMHDEHTMIQNSWNWEANSYLTKILIVSWFMKQLKPTTNWEYFFNALTNKALIDGLRNKRQGDGGMQHDVKLNDKEITILKPCAMKRALKK